MNFKSKEDVAEFRNKVRSLNYELSSLETTFQMQACSRGLAYEEGRLKSRLARGSKESLSTCYQLPYFEASLNSTLEDFTLNLGYSSDHCEFAVIPIDILFLSEKEAEEQGRKFEEETYKRLIEEKMNISEKRKADLEQSERQELQRLLKKYGSSGIKTS